MQIDDADLSRFVEGVLTALYEATDRQGLKIRLSADDQIVVLAAAITAVNNMRGDTELFRPIPINFGDLLQEPRDG
jgi:hypothetical protein